MDRHFIMISNRHKGWFCGKCGKRLLMDEYNASKHAEACGFDGKDENRPLQESDWGYRLEAEKDRLVLFVCRPELVLRRGFPDRFSGMRWAPFFRAAFPKEKKTPEILQNETGMDLATWLGLIRAGRCRRIQRESDAEVIRKVFPGVLGIHSLQMFVYIYQSRGFHYERALPPELERRLLTAASKAPENRNKSGAGRVQSRDADAGPAHKTAGESAQNAAGETAHNTGGENGQRTAQQAGAAQTSPARDPSAVPLQAALYCYRGNTYILRVAIKRETKTISKTKTTSEAAAPSSEAGVPTSEAAASTSEGAAPSSEGAAPSSEAAASSDAKRSPETPLKTPSKEIVFLFSRGYAACSRPAGLNLARILKGNYSLDSRSRTAVRRFDRIYPEYLLEKYAERSANILVPLLAPEFHTGMELAAKAAAPAIAENFDRLEKLEEDPCLHRNLKQMYGLPVSVLQALQRSQVTDEVLEHLRLAYTHNPAFVRFPDFTSSMLSFYLRAAVSADGRQYRLLPETQYTDAELLRMLRYLHEHPDDWQYYYDYLNACRQAGEYVNGLTPAVPIRQAHDRALERIRTHMNHDQMRSFETVVRSDSYLRLTVGECAEGFEEDHYLILAPQKVDDLIDESTNMHNCVRIYAIFVQRGMEKIYFLRKKDNPGKSFGTIEVRDGGLYQAKAFANKKLPKEAQDFVRKWCKAKGLKILTRDIENV